MSTTTIRLPDDLKARIAAAAERAATTPPALILEAVAEEAEEAEGRRDVQELAEKRVAAIAASGKSVPWSEVRTYLQQRAAGKRPRRPGASEARSLIVPRIEIAPEVGEDVNRIFDHLSHLDFENAAERVGANIQALDVPEANPLIGRPAANGMREPLIGRGARATWRFIGTCTSWTRCSCLPCAASAKPNTGEDRRPSATLA